MRKGCPQHADKRFPSRIVSLLQERVMVLAVVFAGIAVLFALGRNAPQREPRAGPPPRGWGIAQRVEVETIYIHPAFVALSKIAAGSPEISSPAALCAYLLSRGSEKAWYAMRATAFEAGGATTLISFCVPYEAPERFEQFVDVLAAAAGKPREHPSTNYSKARIIVMPDDLASEDPRSAITKLFSPPG